MVDEHKHLALQNAMIIPDGNTAACITTIKMEQTCYLPDLVIKEILKKIRSKQTLLNCRLVCVDWNQFIKNTPHLMRRIKFPIWHAKPFFELSIVKERKVKSISLKNCSVLESTKYLNQFIELLKNSIEHIELSYEETTFPDSNQAQQLIKVILKECSNLKKLILGRRIGQRMIVGPGKIFDCRISETIIPSANKLTYLSVAIIAISEVNATEFIKLLGKFPNLEEIRFNGSCHNCPESYLVIFRGLADYIKKYGAGFKLKILSLKFSFICATTAYHAAFVELLMLCEKYCILIQLMPHMNFNYFPAIPHAGNPHLERQPILQTPIFGHLTFEGPQLINLDRFHSFNFRQLRFVFERNLMNGELSSWIPHICTLKRLIVINVHYIQKPLPNEPLVNEIEAAFSSGIPSLKKLDITNEFFDSMNVFRWSEYFPNLSKLKITSCNNTPENFISVFTALERLEHLELGHLPMLLDSAFTAYCVNRFSGSDDSSSSTIMIPPPAIACFRSLKFLGIYLCPKLIETCVVNGIIKCKTLEKLRITHFKDLTENYRELCKFKVQFIKEGRVVITHVS